MKENKEKVSIIVPVYNSEKYLNKCIDSIISQTYSNIEILIIDDGSNDQSVNICHEYKKKDNRIKIIKEKHRGVSNARNVGLENASGDYILFVDSDDWIEKKLIEESISLYKESIADIVIYNLRQFDNKNQRFCKKQKGYKSGFFKIQNILGELLKKEILNAPWNKLYKKSIIDLQNIRFDVNIQIGEDLLFNINYFKAIKNIYITNSKLYNYRIHDKSLTRVYKEEKYIQLMEVNKELINWIIESDLKNKKIVNICQYIKLKNILSCFRDLKNNNCNYSKKQKYEYIKRIKSNTPLIIIYTNGLKIFIISILYTILTPVLLTTIFI